MAAGEGLLGLTPSSDHIWLICRWELNMMVAHS